MQVDTKFWLDVHRRTFKCLGCGECCVRATTELREQSRLLGPHGVLLLPHEKTRIENLGRRLNKKVIIKPFEGVGKNVGGQPQKVISYALHGDPHCPFFRDKRCLIYEYRPTICVAYPVTRTRLGKPLRLDNRCRWVKEHSVKGQIAVLGLSEEAKACNVIERHSRLPFGSQLWQYSATRNMWIIDAR